MGILSVVLFFVMLFGLGALASAFLRKERLSTHFVMMQLGIGLALFIIVSLMLNLAHLPLDWRLYLILSLIGIAIFIFNYGHLVAGLRLKAGEHLREHILFDALIILLVAGMFFVYHTGAFSYPHLENDDSWGHATSIKYVQTQKTLLEPHYTYNVLFGGVGAFQYLDPYPPAYNAVLGVMSQIDSSLLWTMKFYNALFIALSYLFFYCFADLFFGSRRKAALATIVLLAIPAYLSHFIWAIALSLPLYFVALYALERMRGNHAWFIPASIAIGAGLIITPTHSIYFAIFIAIWLLGRIITERKLHLWIVGACASGAIITVLFWWLPMMLRYKTIKALTDGVGFQSTGGTGDRPYSIADFIIARNQNMINAPVGFGIAAIVLLIIGLFVVLRFGKHLLKPDKGYLLITLIWFALMLYAVNAANFALKLSPFRTWMLLAIPLAILAAEGWEHLLEAKGNLFWGSLVGSALLLLLYNQYALSQNSSLGFASLPTLPIVASIIAIPLIFGAGYLGARALKGTPFAVRRISLILFLSCFLLLFLTAFVAKFSVNTVPWTPGGTFMSQEDYNGYMQLLELPPNTPVFTLTYRHASIITGLDKFTCSWCEKDIEFRGRTQDASADEIYSFLKENNYTYVIVDADFAQINGVNETSSLVQEMVGSQRFTLVKNMPGFLALKVV